MLKKGTVLIWILILCIVISTMAYAIDSNYGELYIEEKKIEQQDAAVYFINDYLLIPLRIVFEELGAEVEWHSETDSIYIKMNGSIYWCRFSAPDVHSQENKFITIVDIDRLKSGNEQYYIPLSRFGTKGDYTMINDRTYLYAHTAIALLDYFGYTVDIDEENEIVRIQQNEVVNEVQEKKKGTLLINGVAVDNENTVMIEGGALFPLKTIIEKLGGTVTQSDEDGNIEIVYRSSTYLCEIKSPNPEYSEKDICIKNKQSDKYLYLNPMGFGGGFKMINDSIYLYQEAGKRLFEALGCKVEIDFEHNILSISN